MTNPDREQLNDMAFNLGKFLTEQRAEQIRHRRKVESKVKDETIQRKEN